jgi:hypothetical protein
MSNEWRWATKQIRIEGETLIATDSRSQPDSRTFSLTGAFDEARLLFIERPEILAEVMRALAARLDETQLEERTRRRRAFWLALAPDGCAPLSLSWSYASSTERTVTLDLNGVVALCTAPPPDSYSERVWHSIDDLFFHGPMEPGIPPAARAQVIASILAALGPGSGLDASHAFPEIDHARIAPASWTWDKTDEGESGANAGGPAVIVGYQYGHDYGWSAYSAERVLTGAPEIYLHAPADITAAIVESIRAAMARFR